MERRHAPDAVDTTGRLIADCYCPRCDHYSGGGLCRVCRREVGIEKQEAASRAHPALRAPNEENGQRPLS